MAFYLKNEQVIMADHDKMDKVVDVIVSWEIAHDVEKSQHQRLHLNLTPIDTSWHLQFNLDPAYSTSKKCLTTM
jgi:hypothetical protein